jgi:hypothetical protein
MDKLEIFLAEKFPESFGEFGNLERKTGPLAVFPYLQNLLMVKFPKIAKRLFKRLEDGLFVVNW